MKVIPPLDILGGAVPYNSSIAVGTGDPAVWASGTNYSVGTRVRVDVAKKIYENVVAGVEAISPDLGTSTHWVEIGYMNRYAMFDTIRKTQSFATNTITLDFTYAKRLDSIAILGMSNVTGIHIVVTNISATVVYDETIVISSSTYINTILPPVTGATIDVTITGPGVIYVGTLILGTAEYIGDVQRGAKIGTQNYSTISRDLFGTVSLVPRGGSPIISKNLLAVAGLANKVWSVRDSLNAIPAVWIGLENNSIPEYYASMIILGIYKQFTITYSNPVQIDISLELEEI